MAWKITYHNINIEKAVIELPDSLYAKYIRMTEMMAVHGPSLGMPHTKPMGEGLFELRLKGKEGISRVFYCTLIGKEIRMLHVIIKKTEKTPLQDLALARKRVEEAKNHEKKKS